MVKKKNSKPKRARKRLHLSDNQKWVAGLVLLFFSVYVGYVCASYFFTWSTDQGALTSAAHAVPTGEKGSFGARFGDLMIGQGFGVFGIAIPVVLFILGLRLMRFKPPYLERSVRLTLAFMILGSLTLGLVFGTRWGIFGTGLGGSLGIFAAQWLRGVIGLIGSGLALLCAWILLAVYINRKTISVVNKTGQAIADGGARVGEAVTNLTGRATLDDEEEEEKEEPADEYYEEGEEEDEYEEEPAKPAVKDTPFEVREIGDGSHIIEIEKPEAPVVRPAVARSVDGIFEVVELEPAGNVLGAGGIVVSDGREVDIETLSYEESEKEEIANTLYDPLKELSNYRIPDPDSTLMAHGGKVEVTDSEIKANSDQIIQTLRNFGIEIDKIKATVGPTVTLYEIVPSAGVKISKIKGLEQDIALSLKALGIRIIAPMPGKGTIGIEVPNKNREIVSMHSLIKTIKYQDSKAELPLVLGRTIQNEAFLVDLAKMPHLLIAGATGQGKSVGLNVIISSLLYKKHPAEIKFVMVDPKKVELSLYSRLEKHFLAKMESEDEAILTDTQKVVYTLNSLCGEMEARYELLRKAEVKKISEYNEKFVNRRLNPNKGHRYLPYIVVVIDEFADMIMTAGKEVEQPITRLAQLARATGIHLIIATQRPDVKVITGLIKANFPARIAFRVTSIVDSRTILDQTGANQLIGQGDMLISLNGEITRLQCAFIDTPEIESMTDFIHKQRGYPAAYSLPDYVPESNDKPTGGEIGKLDDMFEEVARFVVSSQQGSTSNIQRRFEVGYNRAGRLMDQLERAGIVGRPEGSKPREVLIQDPRSLERIFEDMGI